MEHLQRIFHVIGNLAQQTLFIIARKKIRFRRVKMAKPAIEPSRKLKGKQG